MDNINVHAEIQLSHGIVQRETFSYEDANEPLYSIKGGKIF
jgi:hypothetical protein